MGIAVAIRRKSSLEECVVHHVTLAAFPTYHPITAPRLPQPSVRLDCHRHRALIRIHKQRPVCSKKSHTDSFSSTSPSNAGPDKDAVGNLLNRR
jgi:hypothetical protein